jgi:Ca-activated chloride channel homolog
MSRFRRGWWLYPLFQIPAIFLAICLILAALFWLLGLGRPNVAVVIALDLSSSTYTPAAFNAPNTVMAQELAAVRSYVEYNSQNLKTPNEIQILGFGENVVPLTNSFSSDQQKIDEELAQSMGESSLEDKIGTTSTDLNQAIEEGTKVVSSIQGRCRELLVVTDGQADVSSEAISKAIDQKVKINAAVVGALAPDLQVAASRTRGLYFEGQGNLQTLFTEKFFPRFNSNRRWLILWLGGAWVSLMWMLCLPLDQWVFQGLIKLPMNLSGQLALGNALFWSVATPLIAWQLWRAFGLPFLSSC